MAKWGDFLKILTQVGPIILLMNPATATLAPVIIHAISEAQLIKGTGAEKKAHAMAVVNDAVIIGHNANVTGFENPAALLATVDNGIDTVVGAVKVVEGTKKAT